MRDPQIPRPLRWAAAAAILPVPGPFDEALLLLVGGLLWLFYRDRLRAGWQQAHPTADSGSLARNEAG